MGKKSHPPACRAGAEGEGEVTMTKRATVHFRVTQYGRPWIVIEPFGGEDLSVFKKTAGFDLLAGTTFEESEKICKFLQDYIEHITET
jgi:hypothetical protein